MAIGHTAGRRTARWLPGFGSVRWLAVPALIFLLVFNALPNVLQFIFAFTSWSTLSPVVKFVGLANFQALLEDGSLQRGVGITLLFAALVTVIQNGVGLILALALEQTTRLNAIFRALFFVPVLISALAVGYTFRGLLDGDGALNSLLGLFTGSVVDRVWLGDRSTAIVVVALIQSWKWVGLTMLIYIAGLNGIPVDFKEAARVEGATSRQTLRWVTLPLLAPAITINVVLTLVGALTSFDVIMATTKGGPARSTEVMNMFIFSQYGSGYLGYATALSLVLFALVCLIAVPLLAILRRRETSL
jgi:raffinose/stachyose/melibiose transport system permease protein